MGRDDARPDQGMGWGGRVGENGKSGHPFFQHRKGAIKDGDKVKKVSFGDTTGLSIKRDDPARRRSFRARHNCDNPGPKTKARYWSCYQWRAGAKVNN